MAGIDKRKVMSDTGIITLPKAYRDYNNIRKGDYLDILYGGVLVVRPNGIKLSPQKELALKVLLD